VEELMRAEDLFFSYDEGETWSLEGLSLTIQRGKKYAFMGANGSGKSTFFLCCNGIHRPNRGTLYFDGKPVSYKSRDLLALRARVGVVFQDPDDQLFSASVYQEISFGALNLGMPEKAARREVERVIDKLEIAPFSHKPAHALSGGQKKQVAIADVLVMHPDMIILDEPCAALDPRHSRIVRGIIDQLTGEGVTVLMSTHDVDYAFSWADEIMLFHRGRLLRQGSPEEVFSDIQALETAGLGRPAALEVFQSLTQKGVLPKGLSVPRDLKALQRYLEDLPSGECPSSL